MALRDRAMGILNEVPWAFPARIGGKKDGIGSSEAWGIQRMSRQRNPMVEFGVPLKDMRGESERRRWGVKKNLGFEGQLWRDIYRLESHRKLRRQVGSSGEYVWADREPLIGTMEKLPMPVGSSDAAIEVPMNKRILPRTLCRENDESSDGCRKFRPCVGSSDTADFSPNWHILLWNWIWIFWRFRLVDMWQLDT